MAEFKIGQTVKVINAGSVYDLYENWARKYSLENWFRCSQPEDGDVGEVVVVGPHGGIERDGTLVAVKIKGQTYIMNEYALEHVEFNAPPTLKPHMRVKVENGAWYIVMPTMTQTISRAVAGAALIGVRNESGWIRLHYEDSDLGFNIVEVYAEPKSDYLNPQSHGDLIWKADPHAKEKAKINEEINSHEEAIAKLYTRLDNLKGA